MNNNTIQLPIPFRIKHKNVQANGQLLYVDDNASFVRVDTITTALPHVQVPHMVREMEGKTYSSVGGFVKLFKQRPYDVNGWVEGIEVQTPSQGWITFKKGTDDTKNFQRLVINSANKAAFTNVVVVPSTKRVSARPALNENEERPTKRARILNEQQQNEPQPNSKIVDLNDDPEDEEGSSSGSDDVHATENAKSPSPIAPPQQQSSQASIVHQLLADLDKVPTTNAALRQELQTAKNRIAELESQLLKSQQRQTETEQLLHKTIHKLQEFVGNKKS